ncbi:MAG TPA: hypothetical protein VGM82_00970 [Gemmatimonadaceae bacterium]|jgi:hypothetical protein
MADMDEILGLNVQLKNGEIAARQLDTLGQKGDNAAKLIATGFSKGDLAILKMMQDVQKLHSEMDAVGKAGLNGFQQQSNGLYGFASGAEKAVEDTKKLAVVQQTAAAAAGVHGLQLGRVAGELGTLGGRLLGVNTAASRFVALLGNATAGSAATIGALAGVVALALEYEYLTKDIRAAREEQERLNKVRDDYLGTLGRPGGDTGTASTAESEKAAALQKQLNDATGSYNALLAQQQDGQKGLGLAIGVAYAKVQTLTGSYDKASAAATVLHDKSMQLANAAHLAVDQAQLEVSHQDALNAAFGQSAVALAKINADYQLRTTLLKDAAEYTGAEKVAMDDAAKSMHAAAIESITLAAAHQELIDRMDQMNAATDLVFEHMRNLVPELHEQTAWFKMIAAALQNLTPQYAQTSAAIRATADASKYLSQNTLTLEQQVSAIGQHNTTSAIAGLNASAAGAQKSILYDAQYTARAIEESVNATVALADAFRLVDKTVAQVLASVGQIGANIGPLIEQLKAFKVPDGAGGNFGSVLGVLGAASPIISGVVGLADAIFGAGNAAREQRQAFLALKQSIDDTTASIKNQLGEISDAQYKNLQLEQERIAQDDKIRATLTAGAGVGGFSDAGKAALEAAIAKAVADNDAQFKALEALNLATEDATKAENALAEARKNASAQDDYQLRFLNATGQDDAAFAFKQQEEVSQAMVDGLDAISMRLLTQTLAAEKAQRENEKQTQILTDQLSTAQAAYDTAKQAYDSLKAFGDSLAVGQYSPLSPREQLDASRSQLNALYQQALTDPNAASQFGGVASTFLDASRKYNASGAGYVLDYNSVSVMTDALKNLYGSQMTDAQKQVSLLQQQLDELKAIDISTGILAMRPALTPTTPTPTPVGGTRPRIDAGGAVVDAIVELRTELNDRIDSLVAVSQAGFVGTIAATQENTSAVEESGTTTRRALDSVTAAVRSA